MNDQNLNTQDIIRNLQQHIDLYRAVCANFEFHNQALENQIQELKNTNKDLIKIIHQQQKKIGELLNTAGELQVEIPVINLLDD